MEPRIAEEVNALYVTVLTNPCTKYLDCFRGGGLNWEQAQELPYSEMLRVLEGPPPTFQSTLHTLDQDVAASHGAGTAHSLDSWGPCSADEMFARLVGADWGDRHERRLKLLLKCKANRIATTATRG